MCSFKWIHIRIVIVMDVWVVYETLAPSARLPIGICFGAAMELRENDKTQRILFCFVRNVEFQRIFVVCVSNGQRIDGAAGLTFGH